MVPKLDFTTKVFTFHVVDERVFGIPWVGRNPGKTQMKQSGTFENLLFSEHVPIRRSNSGRM